MGNVSAPQCDEDTLVFVFVIHHIHENEICHLEDEGDVEGTDRHKVDYVHCIS